MAAPRSMEAQPSYDALLARIVALETEQHADRSLIADLQDRVIERDLAFTHLEGAIASSRRIGAAIGIIMSALRNTEDEAFSLLVRISQRQNRKLRLVADDIVLTGTF